MLSFLLQNCRDSYPTSCVVSAFGYTTSTSTFGYVTFGFMAESSSSRFDLNPARFETGVEIGAKKMSSSFFCTLKNTKTLKKLFLKKYNLQ